MNNEMKFSKGRSVGAVFCVQQRVQIGFIPLEEIKVKSVRYVPCDFSIKIKPLRIMTKSGFILSAKNDKVARAWNMHKMIEYLEMLGEV